MALDYSKYYVEIKEMHDSDTSASDIAKILFKKHNPALKWESFNRGIMRVISTKFKTGVTVASKSSTKPNNYKAPKFVLSAWNIKTGFMMDIDEYCTHYKLPRTDITSYKLVSHTGTPFYNIVFKENNIDVDTIDFDKILSKYENFKPSKKKQHPFKKLASEFDMCTYTDVHIGMDTDSTDNSMYAEDWSAESINSDGDDMVAKILENKSSDTIVVDELGDFLDGFNGFTTRGGHKLPQLMTNEEAFDVALDFKIRMVDKLASRYKSVVLNNICNDNHAGSFGYFVNSALAKFCNRVFDNVSVTNFRQFLNHYYIGDVAFVVSHGKDDKTLKFGFKVKLDSAGLEKIDQYCKRNGIYKRAKQIVFKKGDSHQCLFDMCTSDDFYYFNYPALAPSSQWIQNNFKKGRRGFVLEYWKNNSVQIDPYFINKQSA